MEEDSDRPGMPTFDSADTMDSEEMVDDYSTEGQPSVPFGDGDGVSARHFSPHGVPGVGMDADGVAPLTHPPAYGWPQTTSIPQRGTPVQPVPPGVATG
ncbi:hypothetical protein KC319_g10324, partial [Hortaea werneckii]